MSQILVALSLWLHSLATIIFIGHYVLLAVIYLPAISKNFAAGAGGNVLSEMSKSSRKWIYAALVVLALTGTYLTLVDPKYLGLGDFGNAWAILMLVKHILIVGMLAAGFWFNAIMRVGSMLSANTGSEQALNRYRSFVNGMAISGVLVLLLTALAQMQ
jgi:uncharacterized membrane protein